MEITKEAAVRQMSIYLSYLASRAPLDTPHIKVAVMQKSAQLAISLNKTRDLAEAIQLTYPEYGVGDRMKLAMQLIRGLHQKQALLMKKALGSSTTPLGTTSHASGTVSGMSGGVSTPTSTTVKMASQDPFAE